MERKRKVGMELCLDRMGLGRTLYILISVRNGVTLKGCIEEHRSILLEDATCFCSQADKGLQFEGRFPINEIDTV